MPTIVVHDLAETASSSEGTGGRSESVLPVLIERPSPPTSQRSEANTKLLQDGQQIAPPRSSNNEPETAPASEIEHGIEAREADKPTFSTAAPIVAPAREMLRSVALVDTDHGHNHASAPLPRVLEGKLDIEGMSADIKAKTEPTEFQLDWTSLTSSGLVDPRDRARPLAANMDEIARALVRQALSDQSSWRDRIILVTSARESKPKSMAAINFAFALTTINRHSVVLLDANMNGSGVGLYLGAAAQPGLTKALCDSTLEVSDIALKTNLDRLTLVTSGDFEEDILDRFASRRMLEILRFLTRDPDTLLVIDAPPILSNQETTILSVIAGQVVLVVEAGKTDEDSIRLALKRIGDRHNVALILSDSAGVRPDGTSTVEPYSPSRRRMPAAPKKTKTKHRLRKAVASFVIALGFGLSCLDGTDQPPPDWHRIDLAMLVIPNPSLFEKQLALPEIGSVA